VLGGGGNWEGKVLHRGKWKQKNRGEERTGRNCNKQLRKKGKQRTRREVLDERLWFWKPYN